MARKQLSEKDRTATTYEDAQKKGFLGTVPDTNPNEAYSIQSGPDAPTTTAEDVAEVNTKTASKSSD